MTIQEQFDIYKKAKEMLDGLNVIELGLFNKRITFDPSDGTFNLWAFGNSDNPNHKIKLSLEEFKKIY
jgi:hypothetical protein